MTTQARPLEEWLTKAEAAAALGCSTRTIERHEADGLLPSVMRAGRRWYHREIVEAFDAKQARAAAMTQERHNQNVGTHPSIEASIGGE